MSIGSLETMPISIV
jgi:hypothetical protein